MRHRNNFDLIRLFGALQVVLAHSIEHLGMRSSVSLLGHTIIDMFPGVPIFFVVSGFLIPASFARSATLAEYARNRFLRIYPALWVCFGVTVIMLAAFGALTSDFLRATFGPWALGQLTIVEFYNPQALRGFGVGVVNGSLWTIPVELGFYVLLPLLLLPLGAWRTRRRAVTAVFAAAAVASFAIWLWSRTDHGAIGKLVGVTPAPHFWMFLCGALAYTHQDRVMPLLRGTFPLWLAAYVAAAFAIPPVGVGAALTYALLAATVLSAAFTLPELAHRLLRGNDVSYGTYIYHMLVVNALVALGYHGAWRYVAITFVATLAVATLSWLLIERPALRTKRRVADATPPPAAAAPAPPAGAGTAW